MEGNNSTLELLAPEMFRRLMVDKIAKYAYGCVGCIFDVWMGRTIEPWLELRHCEADTVVLGFVLCNCITFTGVICSLHWFSS
jgi:hypothetical protein